jgi:hypothetical protein
MRLSSIRTTLGLFIIGAIGFCGGIAAARTSQEVLLPGTAPASPTTANSFFAPLWVYPSAEAALPPSVPARPGSGRSILVIREEPSLLTPADLHFSIDEEHGVTVVRGPRAR